jgi:hypothetical protein
MAMSMLSLCFDKEADPNCGELVPRRADSGKDSGGSPQSSACTIVTALALAGSDPMVAARV